MPTARPRSPLLLVAVALLLAASGCRRGEQGATLPGTLTKPVDKYSADEFADFVHTFGFGGGVDKPRKCRKSPECDPAGGKHTSARVDAVDGQDSLSIFLLPTNGVVAVRARNTGGFVESRYGMRPGAFEYYVVVLPAAGDSARWSMQELDTTAGARKLTQIATGVFTPCNHPFKRLVNRANFYTCDDSHMGSDSTRSLQLTSTADTDPIWIGCAHGCCLTM